MEQRKRLHSPDASTSDATDRRVRPRPNSSETFNPLAEQRQRNLERRSSQGSDDGQSIRSDISDESHNSWSSEAVADKHATFEKKLNESLPTQDLITRLDKRYDTHIKHDSENGDYRAQTGVKDTGQPLYDTSIDFQGKEVTIMVADRNKPADSKAPSDFKYDTQIAGEAPALNTSDIVAGQITKAIEQYGERHGIRSIQQFDLEKVSFSSIDNKDTLFVIDRQFGNTSGEIDKRSNPGKYKEFIISPLGKVAAFLVHQHLPTKEIQQVALTKDGRLTFALENKS
jgi:hypothetical protein